MENIESIKIALLIILVGLVMPLDAQPKENSNGGYIYGTIKTLDKDVFTGYIRWGKEEMYWHDVFNSVKTKNFKSNIKQEHSKGGWKDMDWSLSSIWKDNYKSSSHTFACLFGDISSMQLKRGDKVILQFHNGATLEVAGGSNDIGADLNMYDHELGKISFDWDNVSTIIFSEAPEDSDPPYGRALYGKVTTEKRQSYTGHIKWDLDERNGYDILDGESRLGDQKVPFEKINSIWKDRDGESVSITFDSGRSINMDGSNDCDSGNRGIAIYVAGIGSVEIEWDDFESVTFTEPDFTGMQFQDFPTAKSIIAEVLTYDGNIYKGPIAFDKDEIWDLEFIDGDDDDVKYQVPIRNIKMIEPKNRSFSMIHFRNGEKVLLGDRQDVSSANDGILIFHTGDKEPAYVEWDEVELIEFKLRH